MFVPLPDVTATIYLTPPDQGTTAGASPPIEHLIA